MDAVAGLSLEAESGGRESDVLQAQLRILLGTATDADYALVNASRAANEMGRSFDGAAGSLDRLSERASRFIGIDLADQVRRTAVAAQGLRSEADVQVGIDRTLREAAAIRGGEATERDFRRSEAVERGRQAATRQLDGSAAISRPELIEASGQAAGAVFDAQQERLAARTSARSTQRQSDYDREIERIREATDEARTEADAIGLTSRAAAELATQRQLMQAAQRSNLTVDEQRLAQIQATATAYAGQAERVRELQAAERERERLGGAAVSLVRSTATPAETQARELAELQRIQALLDSGDAGLQRQLGEAGLTGDDAATALRRRMSQLTNSDLIDAAHDGSEAWSEFFRTMRDGSADAVTALTALGERLSDIAMDRLVDRPFAAAVDGLITDAFAGNATGAAANENRPEAARSGAAGGLAAAADALGLGDAARALGLGGGSTAAASAITVGTASISVGASVGGGIPDRPDVIGDLARSLGGDTVRGGAGGDLLDDGTRRIGDALDGVAEGVRSEGQGFLGGFGQGLGSIIQGLGGLLGDVGGGVGDVLGSIGSLLGFARGGAFAGSGRIHAFASGGSVRQGAVITTPTLFPLAAGGVGIVREALRDEAILPTMNDGRSIQARGQDGSIMPLGLTRLPGGDLGVVLPETPRLFAQGGVPSREIPAAPPAGGGQAGAGGGGAGANVRVEVIRSDGVRADVQQDRGPDGEHMIRIVAREVERNLVGGLVRGDSDLTQGISGRFALNRAMGNRS